MVREFYLLIHILLLFCLAGSGRAIPTQKHALKHSITRSLKTKLLESKQSSSESHNTSEILVLDEPLCLKIKIFVQKSLDKKIGKSYNYIKNTQKMAATLSDAHNISIEVISIKTIDFVSVYAADVGADDNLRDFAMRMFKKEKSSPNIIHVLFLEPTDYAMQTTGISFQDSLCNDYPAILLYLKPDAKLRDSDDVGQTLIHEMGHVFNLPHESPNSDICPDDLGNCIMLASTYKWDIKKGTFFSKASMKKLVENPFECIEKCVVRNPNDNWPGRCGDGKIDTDEECDCGSPVECQKRGLQDICDSSTCKFIKEENLVH